MPKIGVWVVGFMFGAVGICALFIAAQAYDDVMYYTGLGVFVAAVLFIFFQIKNHYDRGGGGH